MKKKKKFPLQWQAFTSTISTTMVLILMGLVVLCVLTATRVTSAVRENLLVTVTLNDEVSQSDAAKMQSILKTEPYVRDVELIPADQVLQEQIEAIGSDPEEFIGFNPYFTELEMSMEPDYANSDSLEWIIKDIKTKYTAVTDVNYQKDLVDNLNRNLKKITLILTVLASLLLIVLIGLINNTVRLSIYSRRFIIHTMKLVGASWGFIRHPFLVRSMRIALIASALADLILLVGIHSMLNYDAMMHQFITTQNIIIMAVSVFVIGLFIMLLCTYLSVNHFIKLKEHQMWES
ncbi:MAG: permease-like cell division protein FtsX [Bacteroidaceae bacterium]|nr:permease-like cell division protein FtsX [Bacteroidaceae bacterium]